MRKDTSVASRYAKALYLLTERTLAKAGTPLVEQLTRTLEDVKGLAELVRPGTRLGNFLGSPQVRPADKRKVLEQGLSGRAMRSVVVFADLLLRKKRLVLIDEIAVAFEALVEKAQGVQRAEVVSAVPLLDAEVERLHRELERITRGKIRLTAAVEPDLLGGAHVRIGDRVVDRSVRTLLDAIAVQLQEVSV